jgi:hypothetical protein
MTLVQIRNASRMPCWRHLGDERQRLLALIEAAEIKKEVRAALARQMVCTHAVTMAVLSRAGGAYRDDRHVAIMASAIARSFMLSPTKLRRLAAFATTVPRLFGSNGSRFLTVHKRHRQHQLIASRGLK